MSIEIKQFIAPNQQERESHSISRLLTCSQLTVIPSKMTICHPKYSINSGLPTKTIGLVTAESFVVCFGSL